MDSLAILLQAMQLEEQGRQFYLDAADRVQDPDAAALFKQLAADEADHYAYIKREYGALQADQEWIPIPELQPLDQVPLVPLIFPAGKQALEVLPGNASDEDVLLFALGVEGKSYELYSAQSQEADDVTARRLFYQLAAAEQSHYNLLMLRYESRFGYPR